MLNVQQKFRSVHRTKSKEAAPEEDSASSSSSLPAGAERQAFDKFQEAAGLHHKPGLEKDHLCGWQLALPVSLGASRQRAPS